MMLCKNIISYFVKSCKRSEKNKHGSRMNEKLGFAGETLGALRPQTPDQRSSTSGLPLSEITGLGKTNNLRLSPWGLRKYEASGPRKPGKSQGKSELFPQDYSPAFPGCAAFGLASFGCRARSTRLSKLTISPKQQRKIVCLSCQAYSAGEGAGDHPLPRGLGARSAQLLPKQLPLCNSCVSPATIGYVALLLFRPCYI